MRRLMVPLLVCLALLVAGCTSGDGQADEFDDPAEVIDQFDFDDEELAELEELLDQGPPDLAADFPQCGEVFVAGRPTAQVLADVSEHAICLAPAGEPAFLTTYRYACPERAGDVHFAMSPGPSDYGWGIDDGGDWRAWEDEQPAEVCGVAD